ncbi:MAG: right-handed parallel beta-helix repeat-containing protein, partial [Phycisphaerae bacterium]|nr:right-handed parallel beta-helix repeat-containing protein [Phycisphaerae bacterium]
FSDNSADSAGGAIYCDTGSSLAITNSLFADNWADYVGGAIVFDEAAATLTDCVFRSNSTTERAGRSGGAIRAYSSTLKFTGCTFEDNHARTHGGAINADDCQLDFTNCLFANCSAPAGGAMHGYRNNITLANSRFVGNFAPFVSGAYRSMGGGLASSASTITLIDSLFVGNYALQYGGALFPGASDLTIENCTFAQNRAPVGNTLCIYPILYGDSPSWIHIENTIIWDGPNSIAIEDESTLLVAFSDIPGTVPGYGNIDADPCFIDPGRWVDSRDPNIVVDPNHMYAAWVNGDYHLKSQAGRYDPNTQTWVQDDVTSPCIDAGDPNSPLGPEPFPNGGRRNMGAYGGTTETSKSYFGKPPCETIVAGDINGDCIVNSIDYSLMAAHWLGRPVCPDLPARPSPPDHAEDVPLTQLLTWTPSCDATSYRIYFGTTSPARYQGRQEMVLFDPGTLEYNTTYYWHIEEVAPEGTITGPTWTFQTPFRRDPASNPDPYDGQTGVSVYPGLTWTPGIGAESHDVYFGETNPPTYAGNQTSTTYRPREPRRESGLEYSTTYYWRIDEVNPYGTTTGSVWIFRTGAPPDPATDPNPPNEANDVGASAVLSWTADANATSQKVYFSASNPPEFQGSQTETTFTPTALTPATTYYWRIDQVNSFGTTTGEVWTFTTGTTPPGQATNPEPPNDVNNLDPPIALSWSPGSDALSHDVYFGTTSPGEFKGNQAETTFNPGALSPGTAYYWRIDEVGYFGTTTGQVWTFTTGPLPAPPTNPDPADGAIDVGQTPSLSWTGGAGADSYDIYFGTMWDYKNRGNQTEATFDPGTLLPGTQYYWRIAEINIWGTTYGPEWTFTTAADD